MHLRSAIQDVQAFFCRQDRVAVEIGSALFKFRKVFNGLQRTLRTKQALNIDAAQGRRFYAVAIFLRPDVTDQVHRARRVPVHVTIQASDADHAFGFFGLAVRRGVELLLRELCDEQAQTIELLGIENAVEQLVIVAERHDLPFRYIA